MNKILLENEDVTMILGALFELKEIYNKAYMTLAVKDIDALVDELTEQSGVSE